MGTIAARKTRSLFADLNRILAIQALALAQAAELRAIELGEGLSPAGAALVMQVRAVSGPVIDDRPLSPDIERMAVLIGEQSPAG
jgi:histidine ammonia-lyase